MIFGRKKQGLVEFVLVGLSADNLKSMTAGEPISIGPVPGDTALSSMTIILLSGDTEQDIVEALKKAGLVDKDTSVNESP